MAFSFTAHSVSSAAAFRGLPETSGNIGGRIKPKAIYMIIEPATIADVQAIVSILISNKNDPGLFQAPVAEVKKHLADFLVARDPNGSAVGCLGLHRDSNELAEVYGVAVLPKFQGQGIGITLVQQCKARAVSSGITLLWLATMKPDYFRRYSFRPMSRWHLPTSILLRKLRLVFQQPILRWVPTLFGQHTFMLCDLREGRGS